MTEYQLYKSYKNKLNQIKIEGYDNIKFGDVISIDLWQLKSLRMKHILKRLIKYFFLETECINQSNDDYERIIFISATDRKDYMNLVANIGSILDNCNIITIEKLKKIKKFRFNSTKRIISIYNELCKMKLGNKLYIALRINEHIEFIDRFTNEVDINNSKLIITFCDAHQYDNIVVQKCNHIGKKTLTLQHGQYIYQKENQNLHVLPYENFISDYMLVWGKATVDELIKNDISQQRLLVTGCPKFINNEDNILKEKINNEVFGILLNNEQQRQSNYKLIELANKISNITGKKYIIKMHPSNNIEDYNLVIDKLCVIEILDKNKSISEYAHMVEFSIVHTSSVYVELNCMNSPVFRYKDEDYLSMYDCDKDEFSSIEEFLEKYNNLMDDYNSWQKHMDTISKYFVNRVEGTTERYKKIIENIENKKL